MSWFDLGNLGELTTWNAAGGGGVDEAGNGRPPRARKDSDTKKGTAADFRLARAP